MLNRGERRAEILSQLRKLAQNSGESDLGDTYGREGDTNAVRG
jgi:hypothetical protein